MWPVVPVSVYERYALCRAASLGITYRTALGLNPIVFSTPGEVLSGFDFNKEVTSMEVAVRV